MPCAKQLTGAGGVSDTWTWTSAPSPRISMPCGRPP